MKEERQPTQVQATPEQEQLYERLTSNAKKILDSRSEQLLKHVETQDPVDGIAEVSMLVMDRLDQAATAKNVQLDPDVGVQVLNSVVGDLVQKYEEKSGEALDQEQRYQAYSMAVSAYIADALKSGKIEKHELLAAADAAQKTPEGQEIARQLDGLAPKKPRRRPAPAGGQAPQAAPQAAPGGPEAAPTQQPGLLE